MDNNKVIENMDIKWLYDRNKFKELGFCKLKDIASKLSFKDGMITAHKFLYNEEWNEELQNIGVELLYILKNEYKKEWDADWRNDAFLGTACDITLKYDQRYMAFKNAFEKALNPPAELLIELARCCYCPGTPPISYEQAISLLKESLLKHPYKQAAALLKSIYSSMRDTDNEQYWSKVLDQTKDENMHELEPAFLREKRGCRSSHCKDEER